ncbi:leucine-rich repeat receptor-like protein kinase TDR [Oryza brachyantha]|uniref:leucine-rich repeat receptor-like protein kinase TDR n=1 Tax=Oryza brachyantha TaxID=4533 RepID=UPI001ADD5E6F|nr:leucine-rich repeat receptor-like protein kinase TDR [Oryza brachyantha]
MAVTSTFHGSMLLLLPLLTITSASSAPLPLLALLSLKSSLRDPAGALRGWTYAAAASAGATRSLAPPWCAWPGVACDAATGDVVGVDLSRRNLSGTVSATAARLLSPTLTSLNISGNAFAGELPPAVFLLRRLVALDVSHNFFNSTFPDGVAKLGSLTFLDAFSNCFVGDLPRGIGELRRLEHLNLGGSFFNGSIPAEVGQLRRLRFLHLAGNALSGRLPSELGELTLLEHLETGYNAYDGAIPPELGKLVQLRYLDIAAANVSGPLPPELGELPRLEALFLFKNRLAGAIPPRWSHLRALQVLDVSDNQLAGAIPAGLGDLANLTTLNLMSNFLSGTIPATIGALPSLEVLQLWNNSLAGRLPDSLGASRRLVRLDVSTNSLSGPIPPGVCSGNRLARLILFGNQFDSAIPASLANCSSLWRVRLEENRLSGTIPAGFGAIQNLTYMDLSSNSLTGGIPADLVASTSLEYFNVSGNPVGGSLPYMAWRAPKLQVFAASKCALVGELPAFGATGCANLYRLELTGNALSGGIPGDIGSCKRLVSLRLQHNELTGEIPAAIAALPSITEVDLSWNALTGTVPSAFTNCTTLETFDVSFNHLAPAEPSPDAAEGGNAARHTAALWASAVAVAFAGMAVLAGTARWLHLRGDDTAATDATGSGGGGHPNVVVGPWRMTAFQRLNFTADDVARCVEGSDGIVGAGSSGTVYRAKMPNGEVIAVKKLWQAPAAQKEAAAPEKNQKLRQGSDGSSKRTVAEVEVLGHLRHRNIVRLLGWCTNGEATMLLYEYMPNGSLDELLHGAGAAKARPGWDARYKIAVGVAQGVSYLHHDCLPAIAHRDIKPSNILLDDDMEARVADFGVAKALQSAAPMSVVAGSCGYIAPEYTYTLKVDEKSDVYSFGVVLLEILTGRRSVEAEYGEGNNIVEWVRRKVAGGGVRDVIGAAAWAEDGGGARDEMVLVLRVALLCTGRCPQERPSMREVLSMLQEARPDRKTGAMAKKKQAK